MLAFERRMALAELLEQSPVLTVDDLAHRFRVSPQTVRRDFQYLEQKGLISRRYGGAVAREEDQSGRERAFLARESERILQKQAIALAALDLVKPGTTVIMDASTTVFELARALPASIQLTAIVNALPIGAELSRRSQVSLTMLGGTLRHASLSFSGPIAENALHRLFVDTAFISVRGLSLLHGLTEANVSEASLKETMVRNAARVVTLADSSKLERTALSAFAPIRSVSVLVTDDGADPTVVTQLRDAGIDVRVATMVEQSLITPNRAFTGYFGHRKTEATENAQ
jgi:DeoR family fructose operon transcriptional repressor